LSRPLLSLCTQQSQTARTCAQDVHSNNEEHVVVRAKRKKLVFNERPAGSASPEIQAPQSVSAGNSRSLVEGETAPPRPANLNEFKRYAKNMNRLTGIGLNRSYEALAKIYGYADFFSLKRAFASAPQRPNPFDKSGPDEYITAGVESQIRDLSLRAAAIVRSHGHAPADVYKPVITDEVLLKMCSLLVSSPTRLHENFEKFRADHTGDNQAEA